MEEVKLMFDIEKIKGLFKTEPGKAYFLSGLSYYQERNLLCQQNDIITVWNGI